MALEIERRFLVAGDGWRRHSRGVSALSQGYLVAAIDGLTLRVRTSRLLEPSGATGASPMGGARKQPPQAFLTLKAPAPQVSRGEALCRLEFEYEIPIADGEALIALAGGVSLRKQRHDLDLPGGDWVLDLFEDDNAPLVIAEVELSSADQSVPIPPWCVREISGRGDLSNAALARHPFAQWTDAARSELLG